MERLGCKKDSEIWEKDEHILQLRHWASLRGQTLSRTGDSDFYPLHHPHKQDLVIKIFPLVRVH